MGGSTGREQAVNYRLLAENAADLVYHASLDREVLWVAPTVTQTLGWLPEELLGTVMADLVHPDDRRATEQARTQLYQSGRMPMTVPNSMNGRILLRMRHRNGTYRWMTGGAAPVADEAGHITGIIVGMRDVQDLVDARDGAAALAAELQLTRLSMDSAAIGMAIVGPDARFRRVNPAMCRMLEYEEAALLGRTFMDVTHPDDVQRGVADYRRVVAGAADSFTQRKRYLTSKGAIVWADLVASAVRDGDRLIHMIVQLVDVTQEVRSAEALTQSLRRFQLLAENATDVVCHVDQAGRVSWASPSIADVLGRSPADVTGRFVTDLVEPRDADALAEALSGRGGTSDPVELGATIRCADGTARIFSVSVRRLPKGAAAGYVLGMRDVTAQRDARERISLMLSGLNDLLRIPYSVSEQQLFVRAVDLAEALTGSRCAFLHYVNDDGRTVETCAWSSATTAHCRAAHDRHYPIDRVEVWAAALASGVAQVRNEPMLVPGVVGRPDGAPMIQRQLCVPVLDGGRARLLMGLANKTEPYDELDLQVASAIADETWQILHRLREHRALATEVGLFHDHAGDVRMGTWEYDPQNQTVQWGPVARALLGADDVGTAAADAGWAVLAGHLGALEGGRLRTALAGLTPGEGMDLELRGSRSEGSRRPAMRVIGRWEPRPQGTGEHVIGTIADISLQDEAALAKHQAIHDPLTGLLNRWGLTDDLRQRLTALHGRALDGFALHFVDLDDFKSINDTHGHLIGDTVLRQTAQRIQDSVRRGDLAARFGGDEFVVIQAGGPQPHDIAELAQRIVATVSQPIILGELVLRIGASIGVIRCLRSGPDLRLLLEQADEALYEAKRTGVGIVVREPDGDSGLPSA